MFNPRHPNNSVVKKRKRDDHTQRDTKRIKTSETSYSSKKDEIIIPSAIELAFTCYITGKKMNDPVVYKNGKSYEKTALSESYKEGIDYSPNLILKEIMQAISDKNWPLLNELLECPISLERMQNPYIFIMEDGGQSFDKKDDIFRFIRSKKINPMNNKPLSQHHLVENLALREIIQAYPKLEIQLPKKTKTAENKI